MKKNYHTHTIRCHHAIGTEEEYIHQAIAAGFELLGFSDHTPWHYESGFHPIMRMEESQLEDYVHTIRLLEQKYRNQITIQCGLEVEYFSDKMPWLINKIKEYQIDYLILGHHYDQSDETGMYYGFPLKSYSEVKRYTAQVLEAMDTGLFSYLAHPDVVMYHQKDKKSLLELEKICIKAKEIDMPLEFNMLGYLTNRHYPSIPFIDLCKKHHNKIILGVDAHDPSMLNNQNTFLLVEKKLKEEGLEVTDEIKYLR